MYEDPAKTMNKVTDFLGLCRWDWDDVTSKIHNRKEKRYPNSPLPLSSFSIPCPPSCILKMILLKSQKISKNVEGLEEDAG